jgi:predicted GNAT superfamily acetyltransferase
VGPVHTERLAWAQEYGFQDFASDCALDNDVSYAFHRALGFAEVDRIVCFKRRIVCFKRRIVCFKRSVTE